MSHNSGSNWNRWDLHVHTPFSFIQHYGDSQDPEIWEEYIVALENIDKSIKAIGINDYCIIDGYEKLLDYKNKGRLKNIDLLLPVIELRLENITGSMIGNTNRINYHIIFSDTVQCSDIRDSFLANLKCKINLDSKTEQYALTSQGLTTLGKRYKECMPEGKPITTSDIITGFNVFSVTMDDINEALNYTCFKNQHIKAIGFSEWSDIRWDQNPGPKKTLINGTDLVFCASKSQSDFDTNYQNLSKSGLNNKLIHCSDAHFLPNRKQPKETRFLGNTKSWIKSELTFNGLRQLLYEYDSRYRYSDFSPSRIQHDHIIDSVAFRCDDTIFGNQELHLNEGLNTIIGGKSSGKSILLYCIANSIDADQVKNVSSDKTYTFEPNFKFEIKWKDGTKSSYPSNTNKVITYIPQLYINSVAENKSRSGNLNKIVMDALRSNPDFQSKHDELRHNINILQSEISTHLANHIATQDSISKKKQQLNEIGDITQLHTQIQEVNANLEILKAQAQFSDDEQAIYSSLTKEKEDLHPKIKALSEEINLINNIISATDNPESKLSSRIANSIAKQFFLDAPKQASCSDSLKSLINDTTTRIEQSLEQILNNFNSQISSIKANDLAEKSTSENSIIIIEEKLKPFLQKLESQTQFTQSRTLKAQIQTKIDNFKSITTEIQNTAITTSREAVKSCYTKYIETYKSILKLCEEHSTFKNSDSLSLNTSIAFENHQFSTEFVDKFNLRKGINDNIGKAYFDEDNNYIFDINDHASKFLEIFDTISNNGHTLSLKKSILPHMLLSALFNDTLYIQFDIIKNGDNILKMSPGKKGIALFQLYLQLNASEWPILIDQPEDNLDNRTVYKELHDFIKTKKTTRQIIMVTHNPNLVVATDAENIVVANQGNQGTGENSNFHFEYINGGLESSFVQSQEKGVLASKGIREHVCEILEGGEEAFRNREKKYLFD